MTIGSWGFEDCTSLTEINIPNSVTTIGKGAFSGCKSLTEINIPNSVTTIEEDAFYNCPLEVININCQPELGNSVLTTLDKMTSSGCSTTNLKTLQVTFSPSLTNTKTHKQIKDYVTDILALNTTSNGIINAIFNNSGTFNLYLSNTGLSPSDINTLPNNLGWNINYN
jgi:hypothetical protein